MMIAAGVNHWHGVASWDKAERQNPISLTAANVWEGWKLDDGADRTEVCSAPILAVPGQSEPSRKRPFVPIARLLPYGDRRAAPDKVAGSRISPNLIRNGSVALARRWGDRRRKKFELLSDFKGRRFQCRILLDRRAADRRPPTADRQI